MNWRAAYRRDVSTGGQESIWILAHTEGTAREPDGRDVVAGGIVVCGNLVQDVLVHPVRAPLHWGATEIAETIAQHLEAMGGLPPTRSANWACR